jgi:hypothetical protein
MPSLIQKPVLSPPNNPPPPAVGQVPDLAGMQAQLADLGIQATALRATLRGLNRQLNAMRIDNPARAGLQQQAADVGAQLARVEGKMAEIQARIGVVAGVSPDRVTEQGTIAPASSPGPFRRNADPDMIAGMSFVLAMCLVLPISIGIAKRIWRGRPTPAAPRQDDIAPRLDRLEHAVESIAIEIERVSEGQRFVTRILAERPAQSQAALGEAQPPLALGAGPAEPVRVNDGQAVKQGIERR